MRTLRILPPTTDIRALALAALDDDEVTVRQELDRAFRFGGAAGPALEALTDATCRLLAPVICDVAGEIRDVVHGVNG